MHSKRTEAWLICNQIYRQEIGTPGEKPPSPIISIIGTTRILLTAYPAKKQHVYEYIQNESTINTTKSCCAEQKRTNLIVISGPCVATAGCVQGPNFPNTISSYDLICIDVLFGPSGLQHARSECHTFDSETGCIHGV